MSLPYDPDPSHHLVGVHPNLVKVFLRACELFKGRARVIEGVRSAQRQAQLYAQGRTVPGKIVTWVKVSNHQAKADGLGHAIDAVVMKADGSIEWNDSHQYDALDDAMQAASKELGIPIRYGGNWDMDEHRHEHGETDLDHWELH